MGNHAPLISTRGDQLAVTIGCEEAPSRRPVRQAARGARRLWAGQAGRSRGGELAAGGAKATPGPGARRLQLIDSNLRSGPR